ncbi:MAG: helix-turn-helix domain-containing protein [Anaerocolumna aminovalerica]|uniref:helix-turn-helix domain-containing protein n=1 Tax=Anaerocolumna TaxID=1843210 RepID=UPI0028ADB48C|nr:MULTISPECIES: helix-turn-helix domain-containing protein [Anaerocolumna]MDU6265820.1 helix-turn-helix domain-containing protein [Anaerocolumna aminovalerica]
MAKAINYYTVEDVQALLGVSSSKAYQIIRQLNNELKSQGFIVVMGKTPKKYFNEKFYCDESEVNKQLNMAGD